MIHYLKILVDFLFYLGKLAAQLRNRTFKGCVTVVRQALLKTKYLAPQARQTRITGDAMQFVGDRGKFILVLLV